MKKLHLVWAVLTSFTGLAQSSTPRFELGLNLLAIEMSNFLYSNEFELYFANGMQLKTKLNNKCNIRVSAQYFVQSSSGVDDYSEMTTIVAREKVHYSYTNKTFIGAVGVECVFGNAKVKPFLFADVGYRQTIGKNIFDTYKYQLYQYYITGAIGGGVKYHINSNVYVSYETTLEKYVGIFASSNYEIPIFFAPVKTLAFGVRF